MLFFPFAAEQNGVFCRGPTLINYILCTVSCCDHRFLKLKQGFHFNTKSTLNADFADFYSNFDMILLNVVEGLFLFFFNYSIISIAHFSDLKLVSVV